MTSPTKSETDAAAPECSPVEDQYRLAVNMTLAAGIFSAIILMMLLLDYSTRAQQDPADTLAIKKLKADIAEDPQDEEARLAIRELDVILRAKYFQHRRLAASGTWLLVAGVVIGLVAFKWSTMLHRQLPSPTGSGTPKDLETQANQVGRWAVGGLAVVLAVSAVAIAVAIRPVELVEIDTPEPDSEIASSSETPPKPAFVIPAGVPSAEEIAANWPSFRGPGGLGISAHDNIPTSWDATSGENILWKTPVPLPGNNSPTLWEGRVFVAGADEKHREIYCFDADSGELVWQQEIPHKILERLDPESVDEATGLSAPGTATDGRRVYAMFANGDVGACDLGGSLQWARSLGIPDNCYGHAASLAVYQDRLIVQFDQGSSAKKELSKLYALDVASGETVWEIVRPVPNSWASPIIASIDGRDEIITCADPWVISYNPEDGSEIWRAECLSADVGPSAVVADGLIQVGNEYSEWSAIRVGGEGNITDTHIEWTSYDGLPDTCSPLAADGRLFLMASWGTLTCFDSASGENLWEADYDDSFTSSPSWAAGKLYLFGEKGKGWVVEPGDEEAATVAETDLGEECKTCPAFADGRIYIRGKEHLFCIGLK